MTPFPDSSDPHQLSSYTRHLSLVGEGSGEALDVLLKGTVGRQELDVSTVGEQLALSLALEVFLAAERGEAPVLGDNDLLAARELVLRATESLEGKTTVYSSLATFSLSEQARIKHTGVTSADRHDDLTNVDTGNETVGLAESTTHTSLQSIGTGARQHLVDTDDVEGVSADTQVETLLSAVLDEILVGANTGRL